MATQTEKFTVEETFILGLFTHKHMGKSWITIATEGNAYKIKVFPADRGTGSKRITIEKKGSRTFEAAIQAGPVIAAKITWQTDLTGLLMRLEPELSPEYTI